jgi:Caspase domain
MNPKSLRQIGVIVLLASILAAAPSAHLQERGMTVSAGRYFALVIGNDAYRNVPRLKTAEADAKSVETLLREKYGFQTRLLLNATREEIFAALNYYRHELNADASLLIYYAGHGYNDKDIDKAYWLPVDAKLDNSANWISADDITASVKAIPARHVLIISDSCYSGTLSRGISAEPPASSQRQQFLQKMMVGQSRTLMASGGNEPVSDGGGGGHSVFAGALLRGLTQTDKGQFTAAELFRDYVEESVAGLADQTPEYSPLRNSGHESGDFVFVRVKAGGEAAGETVNAPATPTTIDPTVVELAFWDAIKNSNDPEDYKEYLKKYPNGQFASLAERRAVSHARAASAAASPDAPPDFTGTWVLDRGRTTDRSLLMGANTYNVTQDAQRIALASEAGREGRSRTTLSDATYRLDGTETSTENPRERSRNKTSFKSQWKDGGKTLELKQVYEFTYRGNNQAITETQDWALSADGKTLTIKRSVESARGIESTVLILNKQ